MVYGSGDVRKHASLSHCKPRLFKRVEYLDHTGFFTSYPGPGGTSEAEWRGLPRPLPISRFLANLRFENREVDRPQVTCTRMRRHGPHLAEWRCLCRFPSHP
jgi:hypothetical protein